MDSLIERIEAATGKDRQLDLQIKAAVYGGEARMSPFNGEWCLYKAGIDKLVERPRDVSHLAWSSDRYTASLDAAMTLVPVNWTAWELRSHSARTRFSADLSRLSECDSSEEDWAYGRGATTALALCAAALTARTIPHDR